MTAVDDGDTDATLNIFDLQKLWSFEKYRSAFRTRSPIIVFSS